MNETGRRRIAVLGAGRVGAAMIRDLAAEDGFQVTAVDRDPGALDRFDGPIDTVAANLSDPDRVRELATDSDLVVSAVPGSMGYRTLSAIIDAGRDVVDISFFGEDPFDLDERARAAGVTAVVDCGVAPGLSNVIAGRRYERLERMDRYVCYVGGLPNERRWPFEYQAGFSPADVIEEYTRPARYVEDGVEVVKAALTDREIVDLPVVGELEAFNTDGLRSLARTLDVPFMIEKTLRYPGHAELMAVFREAGFFGVDPVDVDGAAVRPLDLTSKLLFDQWRMEEGDEDFTVMRVIVTGAEDGRPVRYTFDLLDRYDAATRTTSMARTTGYTATVVARQVARGLFSQPGICPPEYVGRAPGGYDDLVEGLAARGIRLTVTTDAGGGAR
jgi:saccharopine dehydrogenase-like NADP-dependent oxidoreductase